MSRSNGEFPKYIKLELNAEEWPDNYWDCHRKCAACGLGWPNHKMFTKCPECNLGLSSIKAGPPDMRWPDAVMSFHAARFEALYATWNEGITDEQLPWEELKTDGELDNNKITGAVEELIETSQEKNDIQIR